MSLKKCFVLFLVITTPWLTGCITTGGTNIEVIREGSCSPEACAPDTHIYEGIWGPKQIPTVSIFNLKALLEFGEHISKLVQEAGLKLKKESPACGPTCQQKDRFKSVTSFNLDQANNQESKDCDISFTTTLKSFGRGDYKITAYLSLYNEIERTILPTLGDICREKSGRDDCGVTKISINKAPMDIRVNHYESEGTDLTFLAVEAEIKCGLIEEKETLHSASISGKTILTRECKTVPASACLTNDTNETEQGTGSVTQSDAQSESSAQVSDPLGE
jgi:hypothetical protein